MGAHPRREKNPNSPSVLLPQNHRRHRPIPLGDHVERTRLDVVSAQEPSAIYQVAVVRLLVLVVEVAPVAALMAMQEPGNFVRIDFQRGHTGGQVDVP